jgi:hypothetical protein
MSTLRDTEEGGVGTEEISMKSEVDVLEVDNVVVDITHCNTGNTHTCIH